MRTAPRAAIAALLSAGALAGGCSAGDGPARASRELSEGERFVEDAAPRTVGATPAEREPWRKPRYVPVEEAVARLQGHLDVPVVLPRDRDAGLPNFRGWLADPKYLEWGRTDGVRAGGLKLVKGRKMLLISYGAARFDGCGGGDHAIPTEVAGQPALLYISPGAVWSDLIWPVTPGGSTGRYGLTGTFEGWQIVRLAESMEAARLRAHESHRGC